MKGRHLYGAEGAFAAWSWLLVRANRVHRRNGWLRALLRLFRLQGPVRNLARSWALSFKGTGIPLTPHLAWCDPHARPG